MLESLHRGISRVLAFDVDLEQLVHRLSGRRVCREAEHVYHLDSKPPANDNVCDIDGSELYQREDDKPDVIRARYQKQWVEAAAPVLAYYRERGLVTDVDAGRPADQVAAEVDGIIAKLGQS